MKLSVARWPVKLLRKHMSKKKLEERAEGLKPSASTGLNGYALTDILDLDDLQELQDSFAQASHVASSIADVYGNPITRPSNFTEVCSLIRQTPKGLANCIRSGRTLGEIALKTQRPYCHHCQSIGFVDAAAPIVIEDVHVANWLIGQNSIGKVDEKRVLAYAEEIDADKDQMLEAFRRIPRTSDEQFREKLDFLWLMANRISNQAYQQLKYQNMLAALETTQSELIEYKNNLEKIVNQRTQDLTKAIQKIQQISMTDALTGCFNRGAINESLPKEMRRARRYNNPLTLALFDLDHFKRINDTYGHQSGDLVLKLVVEKVKELIRDDIDWLGRYGGEEFLLVMPLTDLTGAHRIAERLREAIAELPFFFAGETAHVTASFGVCGVLDWRKADEISFETLLSQADNCLYQAKRGGRNRVVGTVLPSPG